MPERDTQGIVEALRGEKRQTHSVYGIDALSALIAFPLDPVSVKIREQSVDVVCAGGVPVPFLGVVL